MKKHVCVFCVLKYYKVTYLPVVITEKEQIFNCLQKALQYRLIPSTEQQQVNFGVKQET